MLQATWVVSNDANVDTSLSANVKQAQQRLQAETLLPLKIFDDVLDCAIELGYSSAITEKRILILDANVAGDALPLVHHLCHIVYIFVYWINFEDSFADSLAQLESKYKKVGICI